MKLLTFYKHKKEKLGVKIDEGIVDIDKILAVYPQARMFNNIMDVIRGGQEAINTLQIFISKLQIEDITPYLLNEEEIRFAPAVTRPSKIICVGLNYKKHADEMNLPYPNEPILFNKFPNALTGHRAKVIIPRYTEQVDYEAELGIIIGKKANDVSEKEALNYVFGYCTTNDLSARDMQNRTSQWMVGKTFDGFAPVGPYVVTKDEIDNPNQLQITTIVNGEQRQYSTTADMVFNVEQLVSYISKYMTLEPGDLILTGTPEGVIMGSPQANRKYLQPGDVVTVEIEKLGTLTTYFVNDLNER